MKINDHFIIHTVSDITVLMPVDCAPEDQNIVTCHNKTAVSIVECLKTETTEEAIVEALMERYEGKKEDIALGVSRFLDVLRSAGALAEQAGSDA